MTNSVLFTYLLHVFQLMLDLLLKGEMCPMLEFEKTPGGGGGEGRGEVSTIKKKKEKPSLFYRIRYVKEMIGKTIPVRRQVC